jgi:chitodextrinase
MRRILPIIAILLTAVLGCKQDSGTGGNAGPAPAIAGISPNYLNPGSPGVEGRISGQNFDGLMSVSLGDGVGVQFQRLSSTEIYVFITVNAAAFPGPRTVIVATTTGGATSAPNLFTVGDNRFPEARFSVSPFRGTKDEVFHFDASKSNDDGQLVDYKWKFGDGRSDHGKKVTHQFGRGGTFEVSLTVTDNRNAAGETSRFVDVDASIPPRPDFTVSPSSGTIDTVFSFDGSRSSDPDGKITHYFWNFGDGASASGQKVQHKFLRNGTFGVALIVTDNSRESNIAARRVDVGGGGPSPSPGPGSACSLGAQNRGLIFGSVVGVNGNTAIVQFPPGTTCANSFYKCGDMRKANTSGLDEFFGIIRSMEDLGNNQFSILNDCPLNWPPVVGQQIFLIHKSCNNNFCK